MAPPAMRAPPIHCCQEMGSWRKSAAMAIAKITLSLSTGATFEAYPSCSARK